MFVHSKDVVLEDLGNGVSRKVLAHSDNMMAVEVHFEKGAIGPIHSHRHEQLTYVLSGVFKFIIGNENKIVRTGDTMHKKSGIEHGCTCLEAGILIDNFYPMREDFL